MEFSYIIFHNIIYITCQHFQRLELWFSSAVNHNVVEILFSILFFVYLLIASKDANKEPPTLDFFVIT